MDRGREGRRHSRHSGDCLTQSPARVAVREADVCDSRPQKYMTLFSIFHGIFEQKQFI